jgi:uncharacterized protein YndB with AHSA1/START domain
MPSSRFGLIEVSVTLTSSAPPAAVWAAFESAPRWPEVLTDLVAARIEPDGKLAAGAVIRSEARPDTRAVDMRYSVTDAEPEKRLALASRLPGLRARTRYLFEPIGDGTRVTVSSEMQAHSLIGRIVQSLRRSHYSGALVSVLQTRTQALLNLAERL